MNYITILDFMVTDLGLKGNELIVFALIYGFCQDEESRFYGSFKYIQDRTGISNYTVNECLKKLVEKGYIIKNKESVKGVNICSYNINSEISQVMRKSHLGCEKTSLGGYEKTSHNIKSIIYKRDNINEEEKNTITEIILYLNKKANKNYKVEAKCHRTPIQARLRDGYTISDFKKVIDTKVEDWLNTDFNEYLVPETLFRPSNMEKYLNKENKKKEHEVEVTW